MIFRYKLLALLNKLRQTRRNLLSTYFCNTYLVLPYLLLIWRLWRHVLCFAHFIYNLYKTCFRRRKVRRVRNPKLRESCARETATSIPLKAVLSASSPQPKALSPLSGSARWPGPEVTPSRGLVRSRPPRDLRADPPGRPRLPATRSVNWDELNWRSSGNKDRVQSIYSSAFYITATWTHSTEIFSIIPH